MKDYVASRAMRNRWLIALAAIGIHICIGSVYAWSVFSKPLQTAFGWNLKEANFTFGLAIFTLGISAAIMGHVVERHGPRVGGLLSTLFWVLGLTGSGWAVSENLPFPEYRLLLLYLSYGLIGGIGLGTGYVTPVSTLIKWFPDRRGLATGMAIMGFGFASFFGAPAISALIVRVGLSNTFLILAGIYALIMLFASLYLAPPPKDWVPNSKTSGHSVQHRHQDLMPMKANEAVRTPAFFGLWLMMFINITCGIAIISVASPMMQEMTGISALMAAAVVGLNGLFNGLGRIGWASFSDRIGRPMTYVLFFILEIAAFQLLPTLKEILYFQMVVYLVMTCYGGGFATLPAYIGDLFGTQQVSAIHGYVLTAWALAGVSGSTLASYLRDSTGSYARMLQIFSGFFLIALAVAIAMLLFVRRKRLEMLSNASETDEPVLCDELDPMEVSETSLTSE
jgi:OFA family oxalate/formate antiporter-like MFS transporter